MNTVNYYDDFLERENLKIAMTSLELHVRITEKFKDAGDSEELKTLYIGLLEAFQTAHNQCLKYIRVWAMKCINTQPVDVSTKIKILKMNLDAQKIPDIKNILEDKTEKNNNIYDLSMLNELCEKATEFLKDTEAFIKKLGKNKK